MGGQWAGLFPLSPCGLSRPKPWLARPGEAKPGHCPAGHVGRAARRQAHPPLLLVLDGAVLDGGLLRLELDEIIDDAERDGTALVDLLQ